MEIVDLLVFVIAASGATAWASPSIAQEHPGKSKYMVACSGCHSESGKGQGPFSEWLNIAAPDLTGLAAANAGELPFLKMFLIVDGRTGVRGHGETMPIWGDCFSVTARENFDIYGAEAVTRGRITVLVDYLQSIQERPFKPLDQRGKSWLQRVSESTRTSRGTYRQQKMLGGDFPLFLRGLSFSLFMPFPAVGAAEPKTCAATTVSVEAESGMLVQQVCKTVRHARLMLGACHLSLPENILLVVSDELSGARQRCIGIYERAQSRISVLSPKGLRSAVNPLSAFADIEEHIFFESVLVHEFTHAVFE